MRIKQLRLEKVKFRKNILLMVFSAISSWILLTLLIIFTEPSNLFLITAFFLLVFSSLYFTTSIVFANSKRGYIISFALLLILFLKYYGVLNLLTTIYVAAPVFAIEIFSFFKKRKIDRRL